MEQQAHTIANITRTKRIEEAITKRNERFRDNIKSCLDSILERRGQRITIDRAQIGDEDGTTRITYEGDKVKEEMKKTYESWLGPEGFNAPEPGSRLANEYRPRGYVEAEWFRETYEDVTEAEIGTALEEMGKDKATGPSGVSRELVQ